MLERHTWIPISMYMGECVICGHARDAEVHRVTVDGWLTDIENAPKDGRDVLFPIEFATRAYWDTDLKRWVLRQQLKMDYVPHPTRYRLLR